MRRFMCFLIFLFLMPLFLLAQGEGLPELPGGTDLEAYVATFLVYAASVMALTEIIGTIITKRRAVLAWVLAVLVGVLAFVLKFGIFADVWYMGLIYIAVGGSIVNGYITADTGKLIVDLLKQWLKRSAKSLFSPRK